MHILIKPNTYIFLTILLFTIPLTWISSWIIAILFHEFCHYIAVILCRGKIYSLKIGLLGAEMQCSNMSDVSQVIAIMCGPIGGLFLACFGQCFPRLALCSFFLSLYNLIPLLPLDGGSVLYILFGNRKWFHYFEKFLLVTLFLCALFLSYFLKIGLLPMATVAILYLKYRKIPCKEGVCKVQ